METLAPAPDLGNLAIVRFAQPATALSFQVRTSAGPEVCPAALFGLNIHMQNSRCRKVAILAFLRGHDSYPVGFGNDDWAFYPELERGHDSRTSPAPPVSQKLAPALARGSRPHILVLRKLLYLDPSPTPWQDAWRSLEDLYMEGAVRAIGVSNFSAGLLRELLGMARVVPAAVQNWMDPFHQDRAVRALCAERGELGRRPRGG